MGVQGWHLHAATTMARLCRRNLGHFIVCLLLHFLSWSTVVCGFAQMKAWTCHGRSQVELVEKLRQASIVFSPEVRKVMEKVDRGYFCPNQPYRDAPQPIGLGQTISAPHMHAHVLEEILPYLQRTKSPFFSILDVGCGSGYLTACFGEWVNPTNPILGRPGVVLGMDVWPNLIDRSTQNIRNYNANLLRQQTVQLGLGDGWQGIVHTNNPSEQQQQQQQLPRLFDAIHVGAAATDFPQPLLMQLKVGGVLLIPVGPEKSIQTLFRVERLRESDTFQSQDFLFQELFGVRYVPLVHP